MEQVMAVEKITAEKSTETNIEKFIHTNHLNNWMGRIYKWDQKGMSGKLKSHAGNFGVLGMDLSGIFLNIVKTPAVAIIQPGILLFTGCVALIDDIVRLTKLDTLEAKTRRKLIRVLPKIANYPPNIVDLAQTILNVFKYTVAFFSSLTIGFISVTTNLWVHHKLGLICNPDLAKKDRKNQIIEAAKDYEGTSLKNAYKEKLKIKVEKKVEKKLRKQVFGNNQYITQDEVFKGQKIKRRHLILDDNNSIKAALDKATQEKRDVAKANFEKSSGHPCSPEEMEHIQGQFWKKLSDPFSFKINDELAPFYQDFLSKYFNWKNPKILNQAQTYKTQPLAFKSKVHFENYLKEYYKWNLTIEEVNSIIAKVDAEVASNKEQMTEAFINAEREVATSKRNKNRKVIEIENACAELDRRVANDFETVLKTKKNELKQKFSDDVNVIHNRVHAIIATEKEILRATQKAGLGLSSEKVNEIIEKHMFAFSPEERKKLHDFALSAFNISDIELVNNQISWDNKLNKEIVAKKLELKKAYIEAAFIVNMKAKIFIETKNKILTATKNEGKNLANDQVKDIIDDLEDEEFKFTADERLELQDYALTAFENDQQKNKEVLKAAKIAPISCLPNIIMN